MINPSLDYYPEIATYLKQSFPQYNINYIAYGRAYNDGRFYHIVSNPNWAIDHMIKNKFPPAGIINFEEIEGKKITYACGNCDRMLGWTEGAYLYAQKRFNIKNLLTIMIKKDTYIDQYMIDLHDNNAINIYLNRLPHIENIFKNLKYQFSDLINKHAKQPIQIEKKFLAMRKLKQHSNQIPEGNFLLCKNDQYIKLSKREHSCLKHLAKGVRRKAWVFKHHNIVTIYFEPVCIIIEKDY